MSGLKICKFVFILLFLVKNVHSFEGIKINRDIETEEFLYEISEPIFDIAHIKKDFIKFYIVENTDLNASAIISSIFVHTGLITVSHNSCALFGVLAHEIGHISRGHILRIYASYSEQANLTTGAYLASLAAMAINPLVSIGMLLGTGQASQASMLIHSRSHEVEADNFAISAIKKMNLSPDGLYETMLYLDKLSNFNKNMPYLRTHPLTSDRIINIRDHLDSNKSCSLSNDIEDKFMRVRAKIMGFFDYKEIVSSTNLNTSYTPSSKNDFYTKYQRIFRLFSLHKYSKALKLIKDLQASGYSNDKFLYEIEGQTQYQLKNYMASIEAYKKNLQLMDRNKSQTRIALAQSMMAINTNDMLNEALIQLNAALMEDANEVGFYNRVFLASTHYLLASVYSKLSNEIMSLVHKAELELLMERKTKARAIAERVKELHTKCSNNNNCKNINNQKIKDLFSIVIDK